MERFASQLILYRFNLLIQKIFPLLLVHINLNLLLNILLQLQHLDLSHQMRQKLGTPVDNVVPFEKILLLFRIQVRIVADEIDQESSILNVFNGKLRLRRNVDRRLDDLEGQIL